MKIFISWSGAKSRAVAMALRKSIPDLLDDVEPWMSEVDISPGWRWNLKMANELELTKFGIICLTRTNVNAPWILFEAGALAKTLTDSFVCPYLIDLNISDIPLGPLSQFQAVKATRDDTMRLILTINKALGDKAVTENRINIFFDTWWDRIWAEMQKLPEEPAVTTVDEKAQEILNLVRELWVRSSSEKTAPSETRTKE